MKNLVSLSINNQLYEEGYNVVTFFGTVYLIYGFLNYGVFGAAGKPGKLALGTSEEVDNTDSGSSDYFLTDLRGTVFGKEAADWGSRVVTYDTSVAGQLGVLFTYQDYQTSGNPVINEIGLFSLALPNLMARFIITGFELQPGTDLTINWILNFLEA